jgi:hypothetical protein
MFALLFCALVKQWLMRTRIGCQGFDMLILDMNGTIYLSSHSMDGYVSERCLCRQ